MNQAQVDEKLRTGDSKGARAGWVFGRETTQKSSTAKWRHDPGTLLPARGWKWHDDEQIEYIVSGKLLIQFPDENDDVKDEWLLEPGDFVYIAAFQKHRGKVVGDEIAIGIMFSPTAYDLPAGQPQLYDSLDHD
jgi:quercetin dioxygenase-like cupin family protein